MLKNFKFLDNNGIIEVLKHKFPDTSIFIETYTLGMQIAKRKVSEKAHEATTYVEKSIINFDNDDNVNDTDVSLNISALSKVFKNRTYDWDNNNYTFQKYHDDYIEVDKTLYSEGCKHLALKSVEGKLNINADMDMELKQIFEEACRDNDQSIKSLRQTRDQIGEKGFLTLTPWQKKYTRNLMHEYKVEKDGDGFILLCDIYYKHLNYVRVLGDIDGYVFNNMVHRYSYESYSSDSIHEDLEYVNDYLNNSMGNLSAQWGPIEKKEYINKLVNISDKEIKIKHNALYYHNTNFSGKKLINMYIDVEKDITLKNFDEDNSKELVEVNDVFECM